MKRYKINNHDITIKANNGLFMACVDKLYKTGRSEAEVLGKIIIHLYPAHDIKPGVKPETAQNWKSHIEKCYRCHESNFDPQKACLYGYTLIRELSEQVL